MSAVVPLESAPRSKSTLHGHLQRCLREALHYAESLDMYADYSKLMELILAAQDEAENGTHAAWTSPEMARAQALDARSRS